MKDKSHVFESLMKMKEEGVDDSKLSSRKRVYKNKSLILSLLNDGNTVEAIYNRLNDANEIDVTLGTFRAYIGDIKGEEGIKRNYKRKK